MMIKNRFALAICILSGFSFHDWSYAAQVDPGESDSSALLLGYNHNRIAQERLLAFVPEMYSESLHTAILINSLVSIDQNASEKVKAAVDDIATVAASKYRSQHQARLIEQNLRNQELRNQGIRVPGFAAMNSSLAMEAKIQELKSKMALMEEEQNYSLGKIEQRKNELKNRLERIKNLEIKPSTVRSGTPLNIIIESIKKSLLEFGFSLQPSDESLELISRLKMSPEDVRDIQLQLDISGGPIVFSATEGAGGLGKIPVSMQDPKILPYVQAIENRLIDLMEMSAPSDLSKVIAELRDKIEQLEKVCDEKLGSAKAAAKRGMQDYKVWTTARDYRKQIKSIVDRMEIESSTDVIRARRGKFHPDIHGSDALAFTRFIIDNGCQVAPAIPGGEAAYVRFHTHLLRLNAVLESEFASRDQTRLAQQDQSSSGQDRGQ